VVGVGFSTGFFIIEADVGESTPASSSNCRCLMLHSFGSVDGEPVSTILDSSLFSRWGLSKSVLDSGGVRSGTEGVTSEVGQTSVSLRWRRTMLQ
jgi:hypothetical protein